ncbi:hypothetical protein CLV49_0408 [Labedella gwakjiensis]|uniref:DUF7882 domain-containing protein n=1 Tax=Labedella gwakjiensis TaxID=390269 RepID=A0A2P8GS63_9MICO|nr:hypothetical protein [Labedella gwakjiensis]PSL36810.1 hypothetical protein CLV49_0408 [Labedella gwakjiensis]RUQ84318.1 hypothetical protein ELQ93_16020 [Labedella gwakjiensis]
MGTLTYGQRDITVDDRTLVHVSVVITQKLRRRESFLLTLPSTNREIRSESLWISAMSDLVFSYAGNRVPALDHEWLESMMTESFSVHGLDLTTHTDSVHGPRPVVRTADARPSARAGGRAW